MCARHVALSVAPQPREWEQYFTLSPTAEDASLPAAKAMKLKGVMKRDCISLASQTHFHKSRKGSGELHIQAVSHWNAINWMM